MKFLFIAPRYHTNQVPIVESLLNQGHAVEYLVYRKGIIEDYSCLTPRVLKPDFLFGLYYSVCYKNKTYEEKERFIIRCFIPSIRYLIRTIIRSKPNVVIMREENYCTMVATLVCKLLFVKKIVLYTQSPQYINNNQIIKQTFLKRIIKRLLVPQLSYTPVKVSDYTDDFSRMILTPKAFIPFVMYFKTDRLNRQYLKGDKINLLDVGKYRDYKNHFILLEALIHLPQQVLGMYSVTIVGQNSTPSEKDYYDRMSTFIDNKGLNGIVELRGPIHHSEMPELYLSNDVFILTSKREIASVSILEAMSYGLVCISTSHNGTTTYPGSNGFVFESENVESLTQVLNEVALLKGKLPFIGENTYKYACENYDASIYYSSLLELCSQS